jgi:dTDP-4-dehydrorhamnose reductase
MSGTLFITGGTGLLGSHLVRLAAKSGRWQQVHATYRSLNPNYHKAYWHYVDARNFMRPVLDRLEPTCIVHTLAMTAPDECEQKKLDAWQINVKATEELADFAQRKKARLIFCSTDQVFDGTKGSYREQDEPAPLNFYGDSKVEAENGIAAALPASSVIARISLMYGFNLNSRPGFFDQMCEALAQRREIKLFTDQFRSPISAGNAAECLLELADHPFTGVIHLGGPDRISRFEFGRLLARIMKTEDGSLRPVPMSDVASRARRPRDVSLDTRLARKTLRTRIVGLEEGLQSVVLSPRNTHAIS